VPARIKTISSGGGGASTAAVADALAAPGSSATPALADALEPAPERGAAEEGEALGRVDKLLGFLLGSSIKRENTPAPTTPITTKAAAHGQTRLFFSGGAAPFGGAFPVETRGEAVSPGAPGARASGGVSAMGSSGARTLTSGRGEA
jgi:hypothetical protein